MSSFTDEGEKLLAQVMFLRTHADRAATLEMGLFTDTSINTETITEATISEPTGGSYARITLTDASWSIVASVASYAEQTFLASGSDYSAAVYGFFIASVGTVQRLLFAEVDPSGPRTITDGDSYDITPNITFD